MAEVGMMNSFKRFHTKEELKLELASYVATLLQESIDEKGKASLLVSGGNTPKEFFKTLSTYEIAWESVFIGLVDERWVPNEHSDSNELLVKENLLQNCASKANFVGLYLGGDAKDSEKMCSQKYKEELSPFDVLILGMGADSHTASLFPNNERLDEAYDLKRDTLCITIEPKTAPHQRMSLTLGAILGAKNIILHIEGEEKLKVYEKALKSDDIFKTPISAVLNNKNIDVEVYFS